MPAWTTFLLALIAANASSRGSGRGAMETDDSVVVKGWGATEALPPVRALNNDVFPALGSPTRPRRSIDPDASAVTGTSQTAVAGPAPEEVTLLPMSKRTNKRKIRAQKKANHGKRPNAGRG